MRREILFRGKLKKSNKFIYGLPTCDFSYIFNSSQVDSCDNYEVIPETIGQFTGMIDKNGTKIFEGDIIKWIDSDGNNRIDKVWYHNGGFVLCNIEHHIGNYIHNYIEVIGNIYDNPELINKQSNG